MQIVLSVEPQLLGQRPPVDHDVSLHISKVRSRSGTGGKACGRAAAGYGASVSDFELVPSTYERLPDFLLTSIPGFRESPEFATVATDVDLPGVIVGAAKNYLVRLEDEDGRGKLGATGRDSLEAAYAALEAMATSNDANVENSVVVDALMYLNCPEVTRGRIVKRLGPSTRALYNQWVAGEER